MRNALPAAVFVAACLFVFSGPALAHHGGGAYDAATYCLNSIAGKLILFGFTWALFHHLLGGIRHAIWDTGHGLDHPQREWLARATLFGGVVLTVTVWTIAFLVR